MKTTVSINLAFIEPKVKGFAEVFRFDLSTKKGREAAQLFENSKGLKYMREMAPKGLNDLREQVESDLGTLLQGQFPGLFLVCIPYLDSRGELRLKAAALDKAELADQCPWHPFLQPAPAPKSTKPTKDEMERDIVNTLLTSVLAAGYSVSVNNGGDDDELDRSTDMTAILAAMFAASEDYLFFYKAGAAADAEPWSWVRLIYVNCGWEVIADYGMNCDSLLESANALAERYSEADEA